MLARSSYLSVYLSLQSEIQATVEETWAGLTAMAWAVAPEFGVATA